MVVKFIIIFLKENRLIFKEIWVDVKINSNLIQEHQNLRPTQYENLPKAHYYFRI